MEMSLLEDLEREPSAEEREHTNFVITAFALRWCREYERWARGKSGMTDMLVDRCTQMAEAWIEEGIRRYGPMDQWPWLPKYLCDFK